MDIFAQATRKKMRFPSGAGFCTVEDLWDLPLLKDNGACLNQTAKNISGALRASQEENFVDRKATGNKTLETQLNVVKAIIEVKIADQNAAEDRAARKVLKEQIMTAIEEKKDTALKGKSLTSLQKMLDEL